MYTIQLNAVTDDIILVECTIYKMKIHWMKGPLMLKDRPR